MNHNLTFEDYEQLHLGFYRALFLQLTLSCPLECAHCCVNSGPRRREHLDVAAIDEGIRSFGSLPTARVVCLTGGEPFVARRELHRALSTCEDLRLCSYVITSAHWATTPAVANRILDSLPPITLLSVSADRFHESFVPLANIKHCITAAMGRNVAVNLLLTLEGDDDPYLSTVADALGSVWNEVDTRVTYLQPVGRATLHSIGQYPSVTEGIPSGPCPMMGTPAVTADGSICACCQVQETNVLMTGAPHALRLGYLGQISFDSVQRSVQTDQLLRAIRHLGPGWILQRAIERGIYVEQRKAYRSICEVCSVIVRDRSRSMQLRNMLLEPSLAAQIDFADDGG